MLVKFFSAALIILIAACNSDKSSLSEDFTPSSSLKVYFSNPTDNLRVFAVSTPNKNTLSTAQICEFNTETKVCVDNTTRSLRDSGTTSTGLQIFTDGEFKAELAPFYKVTVGSEERVFPSKSATPSTNSGTIKMPVNDQDIIVNSSTESNINLRERLRQNNRQYLVVDISASNCGGCTQLAKTEALKQFASNVGPKCEFATLVPNNDLGNWISAVGRDSASHSFAVQSIGQSRISNSGALINAFNIEVFYENRVQKSGWTPTVAVYDLSTGMVVNQGTDQRLAQVAPGADFFQSLQSMCQ